MSMWHTILSQVPNPPATEPPGLGSIINTVLGWLKYGALVGGVAGLLICAIQIIIGRRNRNQYAAEGLTGSMWVIAGLALASAAATLVGVFTI